jgi:thiosulfate reductase cytochrome b subunit
MGIVLQDVMLLEHLLGNLVLFVQVKFYPFVISTLFGFCHIFLTVAGGANDTAKLHTQLSDKKYF